jgi:spore coat polysaccharide biosynthesis protein SpsF
VRTGIFVQVRLGSTRLAVKALLPLPGGSVIQHVMRSLQGVSAEVRALLTDAQSQDVLEPVASAEGWSVLPGPAEDVLARFCTACRHFDVARVVRATGDNPLTSAVLARRILAHHDGHCADLSHYLGNPWGTGVEIVEAAALFAAEHDTVQAEEREHITTFLYRNRERFAIEEPEAPEAMRMPEARVTLDTEEDYRQLGLLFTALYRGRPIEASEIVAWLGGSNGASDG